MKKTRKLTSILLLVAMLFMIATPAMAVDEEEGGEVDTPVTQHTATVTIEGTGEGETLNGHTFAAYQIFTGTQGDNEKVLGNVEWGDGINSAEFLLALKGKNNVTMPSGAVIPTIQLDSKFSNEFKDCYTAADVAAVLGEYNDDAEQAKAFAKLAYQYKTQVKHDLQAGRSSELPHGYYLIEDTTSDVGEGGAYNAALLQVVGNTVEIKVKTGVPTVEKKVQDKNDSTGETSDWQDSADYDIGDSVPFKLAATLPNNVSAYDKYQLVFHDTLSAGLTYDGDSSVVVKIGDKKVTEGFTITHNNGQLTVTFNDVKTVGGTDSSVVTVEYTATLNEHAVIGATGNPNEVYLEYSHNPNDGGEDTNDTPKDIVIVFTFKAVVNKVDKDNNPLKGAEFTLEKKIKDDEAEDGLRWEKITVVTSEEGTKFTFSGLDDGDYRLTESKTPAGYNTIEPIEFTIKAKHSETADLPFLSKLEVVDSNGTVIEGFEIVGTKLPDGVTGNVSIGDNDINLPQFPSGVITTNIVNLQGSQLPETGGIGTTIFYAVGGILVVGAGILLVTKRRMG